MSPFGKSFRENIGTKMHTFVECTSLTVSIKSLFAGATVRPWGILTVGIDVTDETIIALVDVYTEHEEKQNKPEPID